MPTSIKANTRIFERLQHKLHRDISVYVHNKLRIQLESNILIISKQCICDYAYATRRSYNSSSRCKI